MRPAATARRVPRSDPLTPRRAPPPPAAPSCLTRDPLGWVSAVTDWVRPSGIGAAGIGCAPRHGHLLPRRRPSRFVVSADGRRTERIDDPDAGGNNGPAPSQRRSAGRSRRSRDRGSLPFQQPAEVDVLVPVGHAIGQVAQGIRGDVDAARRQTRPLGRGERPVVPDDVPDRIGHPGLPLPARSDERVERRVDTGRRSDSIRRELDRVHAPEQRVACGRLLGEKDLRVMTL